MLIISYGIPRSGSTFLYQLQREMLEMHCERRGMMYLDLEFRNTTAEVEELIAEYADRDDTAAIVKVHCAISEEIATAIRDERVLASATYRSAVEAAASRRAISLVDERFTQASFEKAWTVTLKDIDRFWGWYSTHRVVPVGFPSLVSNPRAVAVSMAVRWKIECDADQLALRYRDRSLIYEYSPRRKPLGPLPYWNGVPRWFQILTG